MSTKNKPHAAIAGKRFRARHWQVPVSHAVTLGMLFAFAIPDDGWAWVSGALAGFLLGVSWVLLFHLLRAGIQRGRKSGRGSRLLDRVSNAWKRLLTRSADSARQRADARRSYRPAITEVQSRPSAIVSPQSDQGSRPRPCFRLLSAALPAAPCWDGWPADPWEAPCWATHGIVTRDQRPVREIRGLKPNRMNGLVDWKCSS